MGRRAPTPEGRPALVGAPRKPCFLAFVSSASGPRAICEPLPFGLTAGSSAHGSGCSGASLGAGECSGPLAPSTAAPAGGRQRLVPRGSPGSGHPRLRALLLPRSHSPRSVFRSPQASASAPGPAPANTWGRAPGNARRGALLRSPAACPWGPRQQQKT